MDRYTDRNQAKQNAKLCIESYLGTITSKKGKQYICPLCGSGTGKNKTPAGQLNEDCTFHCYSCGFHGDIFNLVGKIEGIAEESAKFERTYEILNMQTSTSKTNRKRAKNTKLHAKATPLPIISTSAASAPSISSASSVSPTSTSSSSSTSSTSTSAVSTVKNYKGYYRECHARIEQTDYLSFRGISSTTAKKFMLGFDPAWRSPTALREGKNPPVSPRIIIPTSDESYVARAADPDANPKFKTIKEGSAKLFNKAALYETGQVFVVEGEIDALSVVEAGGQAVALGSTGNRTKFAELCSTEPPKALIILSLDNDEVGRTAQTELAAALRRLNIAFLETNISGAYKDPNEHLTRDAGAFRALIRNDYTSYALSLSFSPSSPSLSSSPSSSLSSSPSVSISVSDENEYESENKNKSRKAASVSAGINDFLKEISSDADTSAIPTGFTIFDRLLDGGIYEGLYIVGAISSLGKTSFILQTADQIARQGRDVLIFSLEMSKTELMAKSISRITFLECKGNRTYAKTAREITVGRRYSGYKKEEIALINDSIKFYSSYTDYLFMYEGIGDMGTPQIREITETHIKETGNKPVVIIDYLQILAPHEPRASDKQNTDRSVFELKRLSRDFKIPVIAISSLNRENYTTSINMSAFKESGAVEYSSDVLLGLQFAGAGKPGFDADAERKKNPRQIELKILKNRNGAAGDSVYFDYYPMFNYFHEKK